jgi:abelson tyrosine-protein kinase 1
MTPAQASNILVDDDTRCVISDFGQSEMKSEVYRITGISQPRTFDFILDVF